MSRVTLWIRCFALGQPLERFEQLGRVGLFGLGHLGVALRADVDPHLQGADHFQLGQRVDQGGSVLLAARRAAGLAWLFCFHVLLGFLAARRSSPRARR